MDLTGLFVPLGLFAMIYGLVYLNVRKKERMALIESGKDAKIFNMESNVAPSLKFALLMIGLALGALFGNVLEEATSLDEGVAYFSMILLFGGIGLLVYYVLGRKKSKE
jgi:predicted MFS family arabinose efflux permease